VKGLKTSHHLYYTSVLEMWYYCTDKRKLTGTDILHCYWWEQIILAMSRYLHLSQVRTRHSFFISAIAIPQLKVSTSATAYPQLLMLHCNCIFALPRSSAEVQTRKNCRTALVDFSNWNSATVSPIRWDPKLYAWVEPEVGSGSVILLEFGASSASANNLGSGWELRAGVRS
jgi:hypothetical protein